MSVTCDPNWTQACWWHRMERGHLKDRGVREILK